MLVRLLFILALSASSRVALAESPLQHNCFAQHLKEAIELNSTRKSLYSELTKGQSERISSKLIRTEKLAKVFAWFYDRKAKAYQEKGIPLLCDEFIPMSEVSAFRPHVSPAVPSPEEFPGLDVSSMKERLEAALKDQDLLAVMNVADEEIRSLDSFPQHFCMTRHILESVRRSARLAPEHARAAVRLRLKSPENISRGFINLQLKTLKTGFSLDREAFSIQAQGVPIICQDVPYIP